MRGTYVYERLPLDAAAEKHCVSYNTTRAWKRKAKANGDDWDKARAASRMASGGLGDITTQMLEDFSLLFLVTVEDIKTGELSGLQKTEALSRLSDAYNKIMKSAVRGTPEIAKLSVALEVLEELAKFIKEQYPSELKVFAAILEPFGARVSEVFG